MLAAEALRIAQAVDDKFLLIIAHHHLGRLQFDRGAFADSVEHWEEALSIGRAWDISDYATANTAGLIVAYCRSGRPEYALEQAGSNLTSVPLWHGEACFLTGRLEEAREVAAQGLTSYRQRGERLFEGWVLHLLGEIAASGDPIEVGRAEGYYREALALAEPRGMRPLVAHCHLGLGTLNRRTGDTANAKEHLTAATTMYCEMGMGFWLEKAEAELGGVER